MAFEFGFGRARGRSWVELLAHDDVFDGRMWILVPIVLLLAPILGWSRTPCPPPVSD